MTYAEFLSKEPSDAKRDIRMMLNGFSDSTQVAVVKIRQGHSVLCQGDARNDIYLLLNGRVSTVVQQPNYASYAFYEFTPYELFGEQEALAGMATIAADVRAKTACRFLVISEGDYLRWVQSDTAIMQKRVRSVLNTLMGQAAQERTSLFLSSEQRFARFLVAYYEKYKGRDGTVVVMQSRPSIAEEIGFSLRTVNRCVRIMADQNAIGLCRGKMTISDEQYSALNQSIVHNRQESNHV